MRDAFEGSLGYPAASGSGLAGDVDRGDGCRSAGFRRRLDWARQVGDRSKADTIVVPSGDAGWAVSKSPSGDRSSSGAEASSDVAGVSETAAVLPRFVSANVQSATPTGRRQTDGLLAAR